VVYACFLVEQRTPFRELDTVLERFDALADLPLLDREYGFRDLVAAGGLPLEEWTVHYDAAVTVQRKNGLEYYTELQLTPEVHKLLVQVDLPWLIPLEAVGEAQGLLQGWEVGRLRAPVIVHPLTGAAWARLVAPLQQPGPPLEVVRRTLETVLEAAMAGTLRLAPIGIMAD
jgi:hypothetical protein